MQYVPGIHLGRACVLCQFDKDYPSMVRAHHEAQGCAPDREHDREKLAEYSYFKQFFEVPNTGV